MSVERVRGREGITGVQFGVLGAVCLPWSATDAVVAADVVLLDGRSVLRAVDTEVLVDLGAQDLDGWLLDGQVGHFNIEAVVMDSLDALSDILGQSGLADLLKASVVWDGTGLMELTEEVIEVNNSPGVLDEGVPVAANLSRSVELLYYLIEIPWECQDIHMLLLVEFLISSDSLVQLSYGCSLCLIFCGCRHLCLREHSLCEHQIVVENKLGPQGRLHHTRKSAGLSAESKSF